MAFPQASTDLIDATAAKLVLKVHGGTRDGERITISGPDCSVGDAPQAGIQLSGPGVREAHCQIHCWDDGVTVEAADPGVHVNGVRSMNWTLKDGDWIRIGSIQLEVLACLGGGQPSTSQHPQAGSAPLHETMSAAGGRHSPQNGVDESSEATSGVNKSLELFRRMGINVAADDGNPEDHKNGADGAGASPTACSTGASEADDAGEILQYMQALLQRAGAPTGAGPENGTAKRPRKTPPVGTSASRQTQSPPASASAAVPSNPALPADIERHRVRVPSNPIDLTAMRALANRTARDAIHCHTRKTLVARVTSSVVVAALSLGCGGALMLASHLAFIPYEYMYAGMAFVVTGGALGLGCIFQAASHTRRVEYDTDTDTDGKNVAAVETEPASGNEA